MALDGTSLTVNSVDGDTFSVLLIPHTLAVTTWGERRTGDLVNIEVDQMARYAARLIEAGGRADRRRPDREPSDQIRIVARLSRSGRRSAGQP